MRFYRRQHSVPELNTTSTADISFMLLIFFLVTTNMDVDKGLTRQLPPADKQEQQESYVSKGTMMTLKITADNKLLVDDKPATMKQLRGRTVAFVNRVGKRHLIKVDVDPSANYDVYFQMQNELVAAYNILRNETAQRLFHQDYALLSQANRDKVKDECPQRIAEQYNGSASQTVPSHSEGGRP
ncbi:MAG: biopolymer transporter ExbD [Prevotella sp.]|nr:biopolymer transporter ExbD [Prevotella sp.]